jgi:dipeptidyl aminopeptidase/acylaminoacyl peptidase
LAVAALTSTSDRSAHAVEEDASKTELPNRHPRMVHEYFITRLKHIEKNADKKRYAITTRQQAEAYVREVRAKIDRCFGPWPEKTPLNARTVKTFEREGYTVENVIYESRPGFLVSANLYVPKGKKLPAPAVLGVCGHSHNGKASRTYQSFSQALAMQGYVVLTIDPIGQGERLQYLGEDLKSWVGGPVFEHMYAGNQQVLVGESFASWRTWDGIRGIDYLVSREEVDTSHIGVTGSSGGGTQSTWICANDRRITMGAPSCFITTFRRNFENELPADSEQYPPFALSQGLVMSDFLATMAPKPEND